MNRKIILLYAIFLWLIPVTCPAAPWYTDDRIAVKIRADKLEWYRHQMVEPYKQIGHSNPRWDKYAITAMESMALHWSESTTRQRDELFVGYHSAIEAIENGCTDPLIAYIMGKAGYDIGCMADSDATGWYVKAAQGMQESNYPAGIKIWSFIRAATFLLKSKTPTAENQNMALDFLNKAQSLLPQVVKDPGVTYNDWYNISGFMWDARKKLKEPLAKIYEDFYAILKQSGAGDSLLYMIEGRYYYDSIKEHRVYDYKKNTREIQARFELYDSALEALSKSWHEDPSNPVAPAMCIPCVLAIEPDRSEMEIWFQRSVAADPYYYEAYLLKLQWLNPGYNGSKHEMMVFARECIKKRNWESQVPLIIFDAHYDLCRLNSRKSRKLQTSYYHDQEIWQEIKYLMQVYLSHYPEDHEKRNLFALVACWAEDWETANEQFQRLGKNIQCARFNDEASYLQWREKAEKYAKKTKETARPTN